MTKTKDQKYLQIIQFTKPTGKYVSSYDRLSEVVGEGYKYLIIQDNSVRNNIWCSSEIILEETILNLNDSK